MENAFPGAAYTWNGSADEHGEWGEKHPLLVSWIESQDCNVGSDFVFGSNGLICLEITFLFHPTLQNLSQTPVLRELLKEVKMSGTIVKIEPPDLALTVCTLKFSL